MSEEREEGRIYREAAEAVLRGPTVEAAGIFRRNVNRSLDDEGEFDGLYLIADFFRGIVGMFNPWVQIRGHFLIAVTHDKVYVLDYGGFEKFVVTSEIAVFDRDEVWLRSSDGGEVIYFEDGKHQVVLDGAVVDEHKGAAEVLAALTKQPRNGATALSE